MFGSNLEPESVVLLDDGLFSLPEQSFSILSLFSKFLPPVWRSVL